MQVSILHSFLGDKVVDFDTESPEGRKKLGEMLNKLLHAGTAIFLERAEKTYRVTGWDPGTDRLVIQNPGRWPTGETKRIDDKVVDAEEVIAAPQLPEHAGGKSKASRKGKRYGPYRASTARGRMTAIAPTAGG